MNLNRRSKLQRKSHGYGGYGVLFISDQVISN